VGRCLGGIGALPEKLLEAELRRLSFIPLIVVDEVGYIPFDPEAANLMCSLVSNRYERRGRQLPAAQGPRRAPSPRSPDRLTACSSRLSRPPCWETRDVPRIDDGSADLGPGRRLKSAWVTLSVPEAQQLLDALTFWAEDLAAAELDPQWHTHLSDADGNELTIAIEPDES
jgi:IstB-like ATP binding protein